jgi:hypothetical protein
MGTNLRGILVRIRIRAVKHKKAIKKSIIALWILTFTNVMPRIVSGNMATMKMEFMVIYLT